MESPEFRRLTVSVEFELRGEIQGLYFLEHCQQEASVLGIFGWVKHAGTGTIKGIIQGPKFKIKQMLLWLSRKGPPGSRIDDFRLHNYRYVPKLEYRNFRVRL